MSGSLKQQQQQQKNQTTEAFGFTEAAFLLSL